MNEYYDPSIGDVIESKGDTPWVVKEVVPREDYSLELLFEDGSRKIYDCTPLLSKPLYEPLRHLEFFLTAYADGTSVAWSDDLDIAPEELYENSISLVNGQ